MATSGEKLCFDARIIGFCHCAAVLRRLRTWTVHPQHPDIFWYFYGNFRSVRWPLQKMPSRSRYEKWNWHVFCTNSKNGLENRSSRFEHKISFVLLCFIKPILGYQCTELSFFTSEPREHVNTIENRRREFLFQGPPLKRFFLVFGLLYRHTVKVGLGISRMNADSQWNPVYNAFHRFFCCENETICR